MSGGEMLNIQAYSLTSRKMKKSADPKNRGHGPRAFESGRS